MRNIKYIVVHCTDTLSGTEIKDIQKYWRETLKWKRDGYHYMVKHNGEIVQLIDEGKLSNGVLGFNQESISIAYIGGRTSTKKCVNTLSARQGESLFNKIVALSEKYPNAQIKGHGEFPNQGGRTCPNFNVKEWLANYTPNLD